MKDFKQINLTYSNKDFEKLKSLKPRCYTWEKFVFDVIVKNKFRNK